MSALATDIINFSKKKEKLKLLKKLKKQRKPTFFAKYKWPLLILLIALVVAYICVYFFFEGNGFISAGIGLDKKDWLAFLGAYLSFSGTIIVSIFAALQAKHFAEIEKDKANESRKKEVQPIFSINIEGMNKLIYGSVNVLNDYNPLIYPEHLNVTICIENVGSYPILNVILFDKYLFQLLKPNDKKFLQVVYPDSPDAGKTKSLIEIQESDYERTECGIPKLFCINYDDVDGNKMSQKFVLQRSGTTDYYSLEGIYGL